MRVVVEPRIIEVTGEQSRLTVQITNTSEIISGYAIQVLGADPDWVAVDDAAPTLFPGSTTTVTITLTTPADLGSGVRRMAVQVREKTPPFRTTVDELELHVAEVPATAVTLDPVTVSAGRRASFGVTVQNTGNTAFNGVFAGSDPEDRIRFRFAPATVELAPKETISARMEVRARRPLLGSPVVRPLGVRLEPERAPGAAPAGDPQAHGSFVQRAVLSRGAISLVGLLAAITIFALMITTAMSGVVSQSAADRDLAIQVAQARDADGASPAAVSGTVRLITTGDPVAGVTVEAFDQRDPAGPVATTATGDEGRYTIEGLGEGAYLLRFHGAGYSEIWYPGSPDSGDAEPVEVAPGQDHDDVDAALGGLPATLAGTVEGDDVSAATISVQIPLDELGEDARRGEVSGTADAEDRRSSAEGAVIRTVPVGSDGSFEIPDVPSPAVYDLTVTKTGFATEVQRIDLAPGEERTGIKIRLRSGDGLIAGDVRGADGPIGGADISASAGESVGRTVSLTEDDIGAFTLRDLPTPGTYTLTVGAAGHAPETLTVNLAAGQQLTGVSVTLGSDAGELFGQAFETPGDVPASGVDVTVSDGSTSVSTVTQSAGDGTAGAWRVSGLAVPSTYTVTFSRSDLEDQTIQVGLDQYGRITSGGDRESGVRVVMRAAGSNLTGRISLRDAVDGSVEPAGNVVVTAVSGPDEYVVTTASQPADDVGRFSIDQLPPGTYTVTAARTGSTPASSTVTLEAGVDRSVDLQLPAPASITVTVIGDEGPLRGALVTLYRATEYTTSAAAVTSARADEAGRVVFADLDAPEHYIADVRLQEAGAPIAASGPITLDLSEAATVQLTARGGQTGDGEWQ
ncbi:carboxypeptidase regulatory-like domain-containing protein [Phytoactinopolyspora alkaliphila]|uniref:Carboxypeptidase regulatory-like domain-containing protein n=1 Tax=Phytoactinopolyspora alkaliphila TaxID=1783498 RepID=A0A6N9YFH0_9ACTN|nr:carboxypeptidase-like regulatory domain-containing protein [Phytoactinopolyspora alkaliphila]NED93733.1 carboxypeptidase regulatory-like domain-containing protein [Phytoactinopolyspora alkaliphila]